MQEITQPGVPYQHIGFSFSPINDPHDPVIKSTPPFYLSI
jgi:hypothetical protein